MSEIQIQSSIRQIPMNVKKMQKVKKNIKKSNYFKMEMGLYPTYTGYSHTIKSREKLEKYEENLNKRYGWKKSWLNYAYDKEPRVAVTPTKLFEELYKVMMTYSKKTEFEMVSSMEVEYELYFRDLKFIKAYLADEHFCESFDRFVMKKNPSIFHVKYYYWREGRLQIRLTGKI
jgi:hypothetical protein